MHVNALVFDPPSSTTVIVHWLGVAAILIIFHDGIHMRSCSFGKQNALICRTLEDLSTRVSDVQLSCSSSVR